MPTAEKCRMCCETLSNQIKGFLIDLRAVTVVSPFKQQVVQVS
jgi:hypothetical protein